MIKGKAASFGIGIGKALVLDDKDIELEFEKIENPALEILKFNQAMEASLAEINELYEQALGTMGIEKAKIFESHSLILQDPEFIDNIYLEINENRHKASYATDLVSRRFMETFQQIDNDYMKERALDIKDVSYRLLKKILNINSVSIKNLSEDTILIAHDITPSQMINLDLKHTLGIVTEFGGKASHTAIMARILGMPAIVGVKEITKFIRTGDYIVINGNNGEIFINPDKETLNHFVEEKIKLDLQQKELQAYLNLPCTTLDKRFVKLEANISSPLDIDSVLNSGATGIGLFRTEFIYMDRESSPTEEEQFSIYKNILERMQDKPVVIRTLDVGADKKISYLKISNEENPSLGLRAIRYCLKNKSLFKTQIRALLRSSVFGNLKIMFPMISKLEEVLILKELISECRLELRQEGLSYREDIKLGIMIEVPSAAIISDLLASHVDFFSIGTNDLIQYVCAADRMNEEIHEIYDPLNPAVLRLIYNVIKVGEETNTEVSICGELAGNHKMTQILLGFGLAKFSMNPGNILGIKKLIRELSFEKARVISKEVLKLSSSSEIKNYFDHNQN
jgi:phosphotransferase system enzyme I (PtsI)